jgi:eukaryotic-like serine/threonine-protein kinase
MQGAAALAAVATAGIVVALSLSHGGADGASQSPNLHVTSPGGARQKPSDTPGLAAGTWIAQLGAVPMSQGSAELRRELKQFRAEVPDAQYLDSSKYASLTPGYWVVYHQGAFSNGTQADNFCAAHGLTTKDQCFGRFVSHNLTDKKYICLPPGNPQDAGCSRPT